MIDIKLLSTQEKQIFSAKCFDNYCLHFNIQDPSIDLLIEHLYAMKESYNLSRWERIGARLPLSGRGDPLPEDLIEKISREKLDEFTTLVDNVVEVGLSDMYGADTDEPYNYTIRCIEILQTNNIDLPIYPRKLAKITGLVY